MSSSDNVASTDDAAGEQPPTLMQQSSLSQQHQQPETVEAEPFPPDFVYDPDHGDMRTRILPNELRQEFNQFHSSFGFPCNRRYNMYYIAENVILTACSNTVQMINLVTMKREIMFGHDMSETRGVGSLTVHPSRQYFAVGERGDHPKIYIYSYPQCEVVRILRMGTDREYSDLEFSHTGDLLSSVGHAPDYALVVWDWRRESVILRTKAFSQDVFHVTFSPVNEGRLITSGAGHIRFWKMASTFTGLKLQGEIGKFGSVELTDIAGFCELPDGKVLSGTENGDFLMWDGNLILYQIQQQDSTSCHRGSIEFIALEGRTIVSGGCDGKVKFWKYDDLEFAEADDDAAVVRIAPEQVIDIGENVRIKSMIRGDDHWLIQDENGGLYRLWVPSYECERISHFHSGAITGVQTSPESHVAVSCGADGSVRCWDILGSRSLYTRSFNTAAKSIVWIPSSVDCDLRSVIVGFEDGVVRVMSRTVETFQLTYAFKPHSSAVTHIAFSPDGQTLATAAADSTVFFCKVEVHPTNSYTPSKITFLPMGFIRLNAPASSLVWDRYSEHVLVASGCEVLEYRKPRVDDYAPDVAVNEGTGVGTSAGDLDGDGNRDTFHITCIQPRVWRVDLEVDPESLNLFGLLSDGVKKAADGSSGGDGSTSGESSASSKKRKAKKDKKKNDDGNEEEEAPPPKQKWLAPEPYESPPEVASVIYGITPGSFYIALKNPRHYTRQSHQKNAVDNVKDYDFQQLYECTFEEEKPIKRIHLGVNIGSVSYLNMARSGVAIIIGTSNGTVQVRPMQDLDFYFHSNLHDAKVAQAELSFDDRFVCSVGEDGQFFVRNISIASGIANIDRSIPTYKYQRPLYAAPEEEEEEKEEQQTTTVMDDDDRDEATKRAEAEEAARLAEETKKRLLAEERAREEALAYHEPRLRPLTMDPEIALALPPPELSEETLAEVVPGEDVTDITDPSTYSIEEAKLKQEQDDRVAAAEAKKAIVREEIAALRRTFLSLIEKNAQLEPEQQLPRSAFALDPKLKEEMHLHAQRQVQEVRRELAWESEKCSLALQKMRGRHLDNVLVEFMKLRGFRNNLLVASFRVQELPDFLRQAVEKIHQLIAEGQMADKENADAAGRSGDGDASGNSRGTGSGAIGASSSSSGDNGGGGGASLGDGQGGASSGGMGGGRKGAGRRRGKADTKNAMSEAQMRKMARLERKKQLVQLKLNKPDVGEDDPRDLAAVAYAERHMGDYKLKSDPNYKVPVSQRVNADKKRRQMILLQESVHFIKMGYNDKFLALRDMKRRIINNIRQDNIRIRELNRLLNVHEDLYEPVLDTSEWPESREVFTKQELADFQRQLESNLGASNVGGSGGAGSGEGQDSGGMGSMGGMTDDDAPDTTSSSLGGGSTTAVGGAGAGDSSTSATGPPAAGSTVAGSGGGDGASGGDGNGAVAASSAGGDIATAAGSGCLPAYDSMQAFTADLLTDLAPVALSPLEIAQKEMQRKLLLHEKRTLLDKINYAISTFDTAVQKLRHEKFKLDCDLKTTDMKLLTLYRELQLLKGFEEAENVLFARLSKARAMKAQVVNEMTQCERQLCLKLEEIETWQEKDKQVLNEFNQVVGGDRSEFYPALLKIFRRKVKRKRKTRGGDDDDDDDDDDSDDYDSADESDDGDSSSDDDVDNDSCPTNCDSAIYEKVLELREKRVEQEEILSDFNKTVVELNKTYERHQAKERAIGKDLAVTEEEIEQFQSEKQKALNQIEVCIPMTIQQISCLEDGKLPADLSDALIFTSTGLQRLRNRIIELGEEKVQLAAQHRDLKRGHKHLLNEIQSKKQAIDVEKRKCEDVQMLKFGQVIDLSILEKVGEDADAAELSSKLKSLEASSARKMRDWDRKIQDAKDELARITQQNTRWLEKVTELTAAQYRLEDQLSKTTKNVHVADTSPLEEKSEDERRQLLQLVQVQEQELDALKAEIHVLKRKGGHCYLPRQ